MLALCVFVRRKKLSNMFMAVWLWLEVWVALSGSVRFTYFINQHNTSICRVMKIYIKF